MQLVEQGALSIDARVADHLRTWREAAASARDGRDRVLVRHLLDHSSGLEAHVRLWESARGRAAFERAIAHAPLAHPPGAHAVYSDLGVMLLGFLIEDAGGAPLDRLFDGSAARVSADLRYLPPASWRDRIAATEIDPATGAPLVGVVHDENARALGGVAAHAGLFGSVTAAGAFARLVLRTFGEATPLARPDTMREFARPSRVPDSSRALAWDTMRPTSSCGTKMSPTAIGHTGFTGTSLWIDWERDLYVVLLTNRVHPTREDAALVALRPRVHDAVVEEVAR